MQKVESFKNEVAMFVTRDVEESVSISQVYDLMSKAIDLHLIDEVKMLLQAGVDPTIHDTKNNTFLREALVAFWDMSSTFLEFKEHRAWRGGDCWYGLDYLNEDYMNQMERSYKNRLEICSIFIDSGSEIMNKDLFSDLKAVSIIPEVLSIIKKEKKEKCVSAFASLAPKNVSIIEKISKFL